MNKIKKFDINYYIKKSLCGLVEIRDEKYPNHIFYKKNNEILFEFNIKNKHFWCSYKNFWCNLDEKLYFSQGEIAEIVRCELKTYLNIEAPIIIIGDVFNNRFFN
jgi:hypothetical protein